MLAGFEGGKYIYTKTFYVPEEYSEKTLILEFEAVYCMALSTPFKERYCLSTERSMQSGILSGNPSIADYVWLPLEFDEEKVSIKWQDEWRLEDYE